MGKARTHSDNRAVLCGICYRKQNDLRQIKSDQLIQLKTLVDSRYSLSDPRFQSVLCKSCVLALSAHTKNPTNPEKGRKLLKPKYENLIPPPVHHTRKSEDQSCPCTVCEMCKVNLTKGSGPSGPMLEKYWTLLFPDLPYPEPQV